MRAYVYVRERERERERSYVTDGYVRKRNDTLQWSREGQKRSLIDNWIIMYSIIMLLCACMYILFFECMLEYCMLICIVLTAFSTSIRLFAYMFTTCARYGFNDLCLLVCMEIRCNFDVYLDTRTNSVSYAFTSHLL